MMFQTMSEHSDVRAAQRCLSEDEIEYILFYGKRRYCQGALIYYLRYKDLPPSECRRNACARLVGACVVLSSDRQTVITVWRNRKTGLKWLRRKPERAARGAVHRARSIGQPMVEHPEG